MVRWAETVVARAERVSLEESEENGGIRLAWPEDAEGGAVVMGRGRMRMRLMFLSPAPTVEASRLVRGCDEKNCAFRRGLLCDRACACSAQPHERPA